MAIKLDEHYTVIPDPSCWILSYRKEGGINPNTGKPSISRDDWFHPTLATALNWYVNELLKESESAKECLSAIGDLETQIEKWVAENLDEAKLLKRIADLENQLEKVLAKKKK